MTAYSLVHAAYMEWPNLNVCRLRTEQDLYVIISLINLKKI